MRHETYFLLFSSDSLPLTRIIIRLFPDEGTRLSLSPLTLNSLTLNSLTNLTNPTSLRRKGRRRDACCFHSLSLQVIPTLCFPSNLFYHVNSVEKALKVF